MHHAQGETVALKNDVLIKAENVSVTYYTFPNDLKKVLTKFCRREQVVEKTDVLKNISLDLRRGEVILLGGSNGTGKSSLLYAICKKIDLAEGSIAVNGKLEAYMQGGGADVDPCEPGINLLIYMAYLHGQNRRSIYPKLDLISKYSGLPRNIIEEQPIYTYSQGMMGRLKSTFYLLYGAEISLYDEVFEGGDEDFVNFWFDKFGKKVEDGFSGIIVSHSANVWKKISSLGGRFIILSNKSIAYEGYDMDEAHKVYMETIKFKSQS